MLNVDKIRHNIDPTENPRQVLQQLLVQFPRERDNFFATARVCLIESA